MSVQRCLDILTESAASVDAEFGEGTEASENLQKCAAFSRDHLDIVKKWGRFPHRNATLGRDNTPEEAAGLADGSIKGF